jgi:dynein heavy chain
MEDIGETLDPALEPVLLKAVFENNGRLQIKLGDQDVDYDKNFLFYLTTKLPNPHYFPEVCIKVTVINFTVTFEGLEEQLLSEVVSKEIPEVLQKRTELMLQMADDKKTLQSLEEQILKLLSESTGNILDDEVLIKTLAESKETSTAVNVRVAEAEITAVEIDVACKEYTHVATSGSILYFVISDLASINPMYQFSLFYFVKLFNKCIDVAVKNDDIDVRLQLLITSIMTNIFINVCRGLFEDNKLTFSFMIATSFQRHFHDINQAEWSLLLRGVGTLDMSKKPPNPDPDFFAEKMWDIVYGIQCLCVEHCGDVCEHITSNIEEWKEWAATDEPHKAPLPMGYDETNEIHYFHQMLLVKAMCGEKVVFAIQEHTKRSLGEDFIIFPSATMSDLYGDSSRSTPIVFVLSTGADPTYMLLRFAEEMGMQDTLGVISLGQGQGPKAQKMIEEACKKGTWVLLQNCHLAKSWMPALEKICDGFEESTLIHKDFRLYLTSMPADYFPVPILQNGVKLTIEPPKGLRANLLRSLGTLTDEILSDSPKEIEWRRLQFGCKFFHAIVQERRKFGPLGWNIRYEFNDSDLETSTVITKNMLDIDGAIPWDTLLFVIGHINYGGRVTDDKDRRCIIAVLEQYVSPPLLDANYEFSNSGLYKCPPNCDTATKDEFIEFVKGFPLAEQPEVFGMHDNANISFMQQESDKLLGVVLSIQPRESGGGGARSPEEIVLEMAADMSARVPQADETAHETTFTISEETGLMNSLGTCLTQEMARFNLLLKKLVATLRDLQKAIKGTIVMTGDLDDMYSCMLINTLPALWGGVNYPSLKPLSSYFEDMVLRVEFFREWVENGVPNAYWVSSFYFPQGFLTSILQAYSRGNMIPVDQLSFEFNLEDTDDPTELEGAPDEGVYLHGLFMDGAAWDYQEGTIADQEFGTMYVRAPVINFVPWQNKVANTDKYLCPLYKTSVRAGTLSTTGHSTNYVLSIEVETSEHPNYWILRGAAMLTMLND